MQVLFRCCAGLDVHKKTVVACVMCLPEDGGPLQKETRKFGTMTADLLELQDWLAAWGCTHVAMESTGVYWKPVYNILEGQFETWVVNAKHCKNVPGHKTDISDAAWIAELLRHGLLKPSFVPPQPQRDLRDLTRSRARLVADRASHLNRLQQVLEGANLKLASVASDIAGVSSRQILRALAEGNTDVEALADLAKGKLRNKRDALAAALTGRVRDHHRFLVAQHLDQLAYFEEQIAAYDTQIRQHLEAMDAPAPATGEASTSSAGEAVPSQGSRGAGHPATPPEPMSYCQAVTWVDPIPGIGERVGETILAETGVDMRRFPGEGHITSWAGVAPGNNESAGKRRSGRVTPGNPVLRKALIQAAHGAIHTNGCYFQAFYRRIVRRRGKKRALVAVARKLLIVIYHMLLWHEPYREMGAETVERRDQETEIRALTRKLEQLGQRVRLEPIAA